MAAQSEKRDDAGSVLLAYRSNFDSSYTLTAGFLRNLVAFVCFFS